MTVGWKVGALTLAALGGACVPVGLSRWSVDMEQALGDFAFAAAMFGLSFVLLSVGASRAGRSQSRDGDVASQPAP